MQCSLEQEGRRAECTGSQHTGWRDGGSRAGARTMTRLQGKERKSHSYQKRRDTEVITIQLLFRSSYHLSVTSQISYTAVNSYFISLSRISTCTAEIKAFLCVDKCINHEWFRFYHKGGSCAVASLCFSPQR